MRIYYELNEEEIRKALEFYIVHRFGVETTGAQIDKLAGNFTAQVQAKDVRYE